MLRLALRNILASRGRFVACVVAIAFSTFLMFFQGGLIIGFLAAAGKLILTPGADAWLAPRGVPCFDFAAPLPSRLADLVRGVPGVSGASEVVAGWARWHSPSGIRRTVLVVGTEPDGGAGYPLPRLVGRREIDGLVIDASDFDSLCLDSVPADIELNDQRARVVAAIDGFGSFLGTPYVFTEAAEARTWLGIDRETASFVFVRFDPEADPGLVLADLRSRFPEIDVHDSKSFARGSGLYWMAETGAGGAIALAGILGFLVGCVVVSQTIHATTLENIEEFATLRAIGATRGYVRGVVLVQALTCCVVGTFFGIASAIPLTALARDHGISWIASPAWWVAVVIALSGLMCALAAVVSIRAAVGVEPARVFRA